MIRRLASLLLCGLLLAGCFGLAPTIPATPVAVDAEAAVYRVNAFRTRSGLGPVRLNDRLMRAAESQALEMASRDRMSHTVSRGATLSRRVSAAGYQWAYVAENIGAGYKSLDAAMAGWEASAGHRKNLLLPGVTEIGIAAAHAPGTRHGTFWALILGGPPPQRAGAWGAAM